MDTYDKAHAVAEHIRGKLPAELSKPLVGIVCGTGLGGLVNILDSEPVEIAYSSIPQFPVSTVAGHAGKLVAGLLRGVRVILMAGRFHTYEGYDAKDTVFPIRVFAALGVEYLVTTNAAGGLAPDAKVGDIMLINDHINLPGLAGLHPLKGPNDERLGVRFLPLSDAYDHELRSLFYKAADSLKIKRTIFEGTYAFVSGPTYETRAEARFLRLSGADAVGMSTVPEVIVARHAGIKVLALSLITNAVVTTPLQTGREELKASLSEGAASHEEVLEVGAQAAKDVEAIVSEVVATLH